MAEAFAAGDWMHAFHPRFCVLFPVLTGAVVKFVGVEGFDACIIVSLFAWTITMLPLFYLTATLYDRKIAWVALALYVMCPDLLRDSLGGLRDSLKTLGLVLSAYSLTLSYLRRDSWRSIISLYLSVLILGTIRVDTIFLAAVVVIVFAFIDKFAYKTWLLALWSLLCIQPQCYLVYKWTGYWAPVLSLVDKLK